MVVVVAAVVVVVAMSGGFGRGSSISSCSSSVKLEGKLSRKQRTEQASKPTTA